MDNFLNYFDKKFGEFFILFILASYVIAGYILLIYLIIDNRKMKKQEKKLRASSGSQEKGYSTGKTLN
jgi:hypothetical protein